jgi:hypothetical protein
MFFYLLTSFFSGCFMLSFCWIGIFVKMQKQKSILAKSFEMQKLFLAPTCTSLCTQEDSKHVKVLSF